MNTKSLFCSVTTLLLFTMACSVKEEDVVTEAVTSLELEFVAESAEGQTKTALQADEKSIWWSPADEISIFYGASEGCKFTSTNTEEVAKTVFRGTLDAFTGETEAGDFNYFWAVYPYSAAVSCDGNSVVAYLSDQQVGKAGSFAPNTNIAIAKSLGLSLGFYNTCSWFRFSVKKEGVKRVIFRGNNNEDVAGKFSISMDSNGTPTAPTVLDGKKEIVLTMPENGTFAVGEMYYITLLPQVFQNGFTVTFETDGESGSRSISSQATYLRSKYNTGVDFDKNVVYSPQPFTITSTGTTSVSISKTGTPDDIVLEYKVEDGDWVSYTIGNSIDLSDGETLQFRAGVDGNESFSNSTSNYYQFSIGGTGTIDVSGFLMSLLDRTSLRNNVSAYCFNRLFANCTKLVNGENLVLSATILANYCYYRMFYGCSGLTSAPVLPATTMENGCYASMFENCSSLASAPVLPATSLANNCYESMFKKCTGLTSAPVLPATTLAQACYMDMFVGCSGLTSAPSLPATTLASSCYYNMFANCTGLTSAPALPATSLQNECYSYMFAACSGLTSAPALPATSLAYGCYWNMFSGCSGLTSAPSLPATTLASSCYNRMFYACTGLTSAPELPATSLASYCYTGMFYQCTKMTSAPELPATSLADGCYYEMFYYCTKLTSAPELPATILANECYAGMFNQCVKLTSAPELPATTLANSCYSSMFYGCTGLTSAPELSATTLRQSCYYRMFYGCTGLTTAPDLPAETLAIQCYSGMFVNCSKLNYIKMLATNISASNCLNGWVSGVAATGTFVKSSSATWDVTGTSGVPSGWTVLSAIPSPEAIDLGLPSGIKWASFNIGASAPEEYGDYYAWGEINPRKYMDTYGDWDVYKFGPSYSLDKYCTNSNYGTVDNLTELESMDDAAYTKWGENWRMPTPSDFQELIDYCTWTMGYYNSTKGFFVQGVNGNSIFLPASGVCLGWEAASYEGDSGYYWSNTLDTGSPDCAKELIFSFSPNSYNVGISSRCSGATIRPVCN